MAGEVTIVFYRATSTIAWRCTSPRLAT